MNMGHPRLLLVEGRNDEFVVYHLLKKNGVSLDLNYFSLEGVGNFEARLKVRLEESGLERLGILLDADDEIDSRWRKIRKVFEGKGYPPLAERPDPEGTVIESPHPLAPRVGFWFMPDNQNQGMLEDFLVQLVPAGNRLWERAGAVVGEIPEAERLFKEHYHVKARVHTLLAWQKQPGIPMGLAIERGVFNPTSPLVTLFLAWMKRLYA